MLIPIALAVIVFLITLNILGPIMPGNSLTVSLIAGALIFIASRKRLEQIGFERDKTEIYTYNMPAPQAFSLIKKVLRTFRWGERKWQIADADETALTIRAVSEWKDYAFKDYKWLAPDGGLFRQVMLNVKVQQDLGTGLANIEMAWIVNSALTRGECDRLQDHTKVAIRQVLEDNQMDKSFKVEIL